ncbi:hypothetical protein AWC38_SpisGene17396 [Stylophora pistillata]|uniref:Uncharacterized protein n=1 Tax=Stylophora pistillata TaxID=50429 RepID=A0A2B4RNZ2_STYPI|nr:hypothetical protein AWC38_SpisGene17396 [Stylophora pistillata]
MRTPDGEGWQLKDSEHCFTRQNVQQHVAGIWKKKCLKAYQSVRSQPVKEMVDSMCSVRTQVFSAATVYPGQFAKNHGEDYASLEQVTDYNDGSEGDYEGNDPGEGEISEDYANKMYMEQYFEMDDTVD